ncbi:glycosyltransferase family 2 protein [Parapedobacter sp. DT-150]|uniref:glycosyltransferase family 2 protein n=1 Tax=Parapedobacter sp. DT-150 TaxID=3396162 RepID=UPI003F1A381E
MYQFNDVTLLITHHNRSRSLERLLAKFNELGCAFAEIVVSDDSSKSDHLDYITGLAAKYPVRIITSPVNGGLGNNLNKGQKVVNTRYTLYVQEDFVPTADAPRNLQQGLELLKENERFDMVRFYAYNRYPYLVPLKHGFSEMLFSPWSPGLGKFAYYSDHPHLRKSDFLEKFGPYAEGISGDQTEFRMMMSFLRKGGKALFFEDHKAVFDQVNSAAEPSTMKRDFLRNSENPFVVAARTLYRYINFYFGYFFGKSLRLP